MMGNSLRTVLFPADRIAIWSESFLRRVERPSLYAAPILMWLPVWLGLTPASSLLVFVAVGCLAWLLWRAEPIETRQMWAGVFALALCVRLVVVTLAIYVGAQNGLTQLGPDGQMYFSRSLKMAAEPWAWPSTVGFDTADVGHYFLFSAALRAFHSNLFGLRLLNAAIDALAAGCAFGIWTMVVPRWAALAGLLTALYTPLIYDATFDLWKDPSAMCALVFAVWAVLRASRATGARDLVLQSLVAGLALAYTYCTRMYWAFYLEVAAVFTLALIATTGVEWRRYRKPLVAGAVMVALCELGPHVLGWPYSIQAFRATLTHVTTTEQMTARPTGSMDVLGGRGAEARGRAGVSGHGAEAGGRGAEVARLARGATGDTVRLALTLFRKIWGPYVWVRPKVFTVREILRGGFMMFPGILVWYILLPSIVSGLAVTIVGALRGRATSWVLVWLAIYLVICLAQYLVLAQSFRQRDGLFPFLVLFAFLGWSWGHSRRWWRPFHYAYALGLLAVAGAHIASGNAVF